MAHRVGNRVAENFTGTSGNITATGAINGLKTLASLLVTNGDTGDFVLAGGTNGAQWERTRLTRVSATEYSRADPGAYTRFESSTGATVTFGAGTLEAFIDVFAGDLLQTEAANAFTAAQKAQVRRNIFQGAVAKSGAFTVGADDNGKVFVCTGTWSMSVTAAATLGAMFSFEVINAGTGTITIDPDGSETIDGAATLAIPVMGRTTVYCDGAALYTIHRPRNLISSTVAAGSAVSLTNGTQTNIAQIDVPSGVWDISGSLIFRPSNAGTSVTNLNASIGPTSATFVATPGLFGNWIGGAFVPGSGVDIDVNFGPGQVTLTAPATYYLVAFPFFTVSTLTGYGLIRARPVE